MKLRITLDIDVPGITEAGDIHTDHTLHSLARSYFIHQYDDATTVVPMDGLEAFESAVIDTIINDGIGSYVASCNLAIEIPRSFIEPRED